MEFIKYSTITRGFMCIYKFVYERATTSVRRKFISDYKNIVKKLMKIFEKALRDRREAENKLQLRNNRNKYL